MRSVVWFRVQDLRVSDHGPLSDAVDGGAVLPLFVIDPARFTPERVAARPHATQFLVDSLRALGERLESLGSQLVVVRGRSVEVVPRLADAWRADRVLAQRRSAPAARARDARISAALGDRFRLYGGETLCPPGSLRTTAGDPYSVFGAFKRKLVKQVVVGQPLPAPWELPPVPPDVAAQSEALPTCAELSLDRNAQLLAGGERAAHARLRRFLEGPIERYPDRRDRLDAEGTSRLSADLAHGTLSPRQAWVASLEASPAGAAGQRFREQLLWREFAYSTLWDRPEVLEHPFRPAFEGFPWQGDAGLFDAWREGQTGYPVVDAAANELRESGFVHNRARMIAASFLTKHLLVDYRRGEAHYLRYLTDGDPPQNNLGWQWSAGCGCDAQPYFRVFNPMTQGERFDPEGAYVGRWLPALRALPARFIHRPWEAPANVLDAAGVRFGQTYPWPVVDHAFARERFLWTASQHLRAG